MDSDERRWTTNGRGIVQKEETRRTLDFGVLSSPNSSPMEYDGMGRSSDESSEARHDHRPEPGSSLWRSAQFWQVMFLAAIFSVFGLYVTSELLDALCESCAMAREPVSLYFCLAVVYLWCTFALGEDAPEILAAGLFTAMFGTPALVALYPDAPWGLLTTAAVYSFIVCTEVLREDKYRRNRERRRNRGPTGDSGPSASVVRIVWALILILIAIVTLYGLSLGTISFPWVLDLQALHDRMPAVDIAFRDFLDPRALLAYALGLVVVLAAIFDAHRTWSSPPSFPISELEMWHSEDSRVGFLATVLSPLLLVLDILRLVFLYAARVIWEIVARILWGLGFFARALAHHVVNVCVDWLTWKTVGKAAITLVAVFLLVKAAPIYVTALVDYLESSNPVLDTSLKAYVLLGFLSASFLFVAVAIAFLVQMWEEARSPSFIRRLAMRSMLIVVAAYLSGWVLLALARWPFLQIRGFDAPGPFTATVTAVIVIVGTWEILRRMVLRQSPSRDHVSIGGSARPSQPVGASILQEETSGPASDLSRPKPRPPVPEPGRVNEPLSPVPELLSTSSALCQRLDEGRRGPRASRPSSPSDSATREPVSSHVSAGQSIGPPGEGRDGRAGRPRWRRDPNRKSLFDPTDDE